jgi:hypothetical protein
MNTRRQSFATNAGPRLAVRFVTRWNVYFRGDVATFPNRMAQRLVERGIAEPVNIAPDDAMPPENAEWTIRPSGEAPLRQGDEGDIDFL